MSSKLPRLGRSHMTEPGRRQDEPIGSSALSTQGPATCVGGSKLDDPTTISVQARDGWPDLPAPEAYYGLAGDIVRALEPQTEASPVALLMQILVCFGNVVGRNAHFVVEGSRHFTNIFAVLVGPTSVGRKGSSWSQVSCLFRDVDPDWVTQGIQSGLSSGEGLVWVVRDPVVGREPLREKGCIKGYQQVETDPGVSDKRLLVLESEFASPLRMMARTGSTLSPVIRQAWDTGDLGTMTKHSRARATGAHISIVGHITRNELRRELSVGNMWNGLVNRFLWVCTTRSKELPEGGNFVGVNLVPLVERLQSAVTFAQTVGEIRRDDSVKEMWARLYHELTADRLGLMGAVTSRAAAQVMRLSMLQALLDKFTVMRAKHMLAAVALWEYCESSARFIFGVTLGDFTADTILKALRASPSGLDRTAISALFKRHKTAGEISQALAVLSEHGLATSRTVSEKTSHRTPEVWFATSIGAKKAK